MNNLYPVFVASHTRLLNAIFSKDEDDDYTEDFFGNTIFYYSESLDKIVTPTDIEKYHLQINKPDDILKNNPDIKCHFKRLPYAEALTDMAIQENAADGYDITLPQSNRFSISMVASRSFADDLDCKILPYVVLLDYQIA